MNGLRVACGIAPTFDFSQPQRVLRAFEVSAALDAFDEAERLLRDGAWIAGYVSYELGAAFAHEPVRRSTWPLLALGAFERPREIDDAGALAAHESTVLLAESSYDEYRRAIDAIRASIYDGDVYQVNHTVPFAFDPPQNPYAWWQAIAMRTGAPYQAYVEDEERRILSWSPELFLRFSGERVETRPMKGTAPPEANGELYGTKNRAEHVMIVDLLRNDLHRICSNVRVERLLEVERYPTFATMTSTIAGDLAANRELREIFAATFPCGSVTGAPKRAAIAHIARLEQRTRDAYCGTIGFLSPQRRGWWNVAIRTAQIDLKRASARFDAGGGIVADSNAHDEWNEVQLKTAFLRERAPSLVLLETFAAHAQAPVVERHLARLCATAERLGVPLERTMLDAALHDVNARTDALIRLRVSLDGTVHAASEPLATPTDIRACLAPQRVRSNDPFLRVKTSRRPAHDAAMAHARERGCFDAILRNERGELTEGTRTNLFVERSGTLLTPPLGCGLLPGILRERLVTEGRAREAVLLPEDLERADAVYLGNSARGLLRVTLVKDPS